MQKHFSFRSGKQWFAIPLALLAILVMSSGLAFAGGLDVRDDARILSNSDITSLRDTASRIRPNVRIITTKNYTNLSQFQNYIVSNLPDQNSVVVGVSDNPSLRDTFIKAGNNTGINDQEASNAAAAGNSSFKQGNFGAGLNSIVQSLGTFANSSSAPRNSAPAPATSSGGSSLGFLCLPIGLIAIVGLGLYFFSRRRNYGPVNQGPIMGPGPGYGPGPNYGPGYGPNYGPGYGPGYGGGGSGLGAGLGGAALGGLAGYELGKMSGEHERGNFNNGGFNNSGNNDWGNGGNLDAGGGVGNSDWGSGGSDFGSSGGSDWGSGGGGGDIGSAGGSFDSGGGGGGGDSSW